MDIGDNRFMNDKLASTILACSMLASMGHALPPPGVSLTILADLGFQRREHGITDSEGGRLSYGYPDQVADSKISPPLRAINPRTFLRKTMGLVTGPWESEVALSGYPIGVDNCATAHGSGGNFSAQVPGFQSFVRVSWYGPSVRRNGAARFGEPKNPELFSKLEGAVRWMSANAELRGATTQSVSVSGRSYNGLKNLAGRLHVRASEFAQREGYQLIVNRNAGRFMLRTSQRDIIFPLACNQMKVGSEWVSAEVMISAVEDELYIPVAMIQSANL